MNTLPHVHRPAEHGPRRRRPPWRQRLVEAERGITQGFRSDSTLFVHFFVGSVLVAAGVVLEINLVEWTILILALSGVWAAELFQQALRLLAPELSVEHGQDELPDGDSGERAAVQKASRLATAAVFVTIAGGAASIGIIFVRRLMLMFGGL